MDRIAGARYGPGDRLPSVRALAGEALVNPNTVSKAYRELEAQGVVVGRKGSGVFVTPSGPKVAARIRRRATQQALIIAFQDALDAGHDPSELFDALDRKSSMRGEPVS